MSTREECRDEIDSIRRAIRYQASDREGRGRRDSYMTIATWFFRRGNYICDPITFFLDSYLLKYLHSHISFIGDYLLKPPRSFIFHRPQLGFIIFMIRKVQLHSS